MDEVKTIWIPKYLEDGETWLSLWPIVLTAILVAAIASIAIVMVLNKRTLFGFAFAGMLAFSMLGIVAGNLAGLSRDPVVGTVIPTVLTFVGSVMAYLFGSRSLLRQLFVAAGVISLCVSLLIGMYWGSRARIVFEYDARARQVQHDEAVAAQTTPLALEQQNYLLALTKLKQEIEFQKIKTLLEAKHRLTLTTTYPAK